MDELRQCVYHTYNYEINSGGMVWLSDILDEAGSPASGVNVVYNGSVINQARYVKIAVAASSAVGGSNSTDALLGVTVGNRDSTPNLALADRHSDIIGPVDVAGNTSFETEFAHSLDVGLAIAGGSSDPILVNIQVFA